MKIIAVTQARYGSTRLPAKILRKVNGTTLLQTHMERILQSKKISALKVATTNEEGSERIVEIADLLGVSTYRGSVDDVLDRFYQTVKDEKPDYVVRLTSDCPLIDPKIIDKVIAIAERSGVDYVSNTLDVSYPDGMDCECFKFTALEKAWREATLKSDREHVTPYIWKNSTEKNGKLFTSECLKNAEDWSDIRLTVDTPEDFEVIKTVLLEMGAECDCKEYVEFIKENKNISDLNSSFKRNEGYEKSIKED